MSKKSNQRNQRVQQIVKAAAKEEKKILPVLEVSAEEMTAAIQEAATEDPISTEKVADVSLKVEDGNVSSTEEEKEEGKVQLKVKEEYSLNNFLEEMDVLGMNERDKDLAGKYYMILVERLTDIKRKDLVNLLFADKGRLFRLVLLTRFKNFNQETCGFIYMHMSLNNKWGGYKPELSVRRSGASLNHVIIRGKEVHLFDIPGVIVGKTILAAELASLK